MCEDASKTRLSTFPPLQPSRPSVQTDHCRCCASGCLAFSLTGATRPDCIRLPAVFSCGMPEEARPQETPRGVLGDRGGGRRACGVSVVHRSCLLVQIARSCSRMGRRYGPFVLHAVRTHRRVRHDLRWLAGWSRWVGHHQQRRADGLPQRSTKRSKRGAIPCETVRRGATKGG
jgi:hypothetical protein